MVTLVSKERAVDSMVRLGDELNDYWRKDETHALGGLKIAVNRLLISRGNMIRMRPKRAELARYLLARFRFLLHHHHHNNNND